MACCNRWHYLRAVVKAFFSPYPSGRCLVVTALDLIDVSQEDHDEPGDYELHLYGHNYEGGWGGSLAPAKE